MRSSVTSSDNDAVLINFDDVSDYNPEQILPVCAEDLGRIRHWLQPTSYDLDGGEYHKHLRTHLPGTGDWLSSSSTYQSWLNDDHKGLLWITGIPGSGKSVIASKLVHELSNSNPGTPITFFFFRQIIDANHKPVALLRDWLDQLLRYSPPLQQCLKKSYVDQRRPLASLSMDEWWKLVRMALSGLPRRSFCIADALDEIDQGNEDFLASLAALGKWRPEKVKVLLTSRPVPSVERALRLAKPLRIRLEEKHVDIDIAKFVQHSLSRSTMGQEDQDHIRKAVPGRANGLFLYAKLAMDAFLEPGVNVGHALEKLPLDLNQLYTDLLNEHCQKSGVPDDTQRLILGAVTHATRPLRLIELAEMIRTTSSSLHRLDMKSAKDLVRAACGPLLEILPNETVSVIHHSLTEYLNGTTRYNQASGYLILQSDTVHFDLALVCLKYLRLGSLGVDENSDTGEDSLLDYLFDLEDGNRLRLAYPFAQYARDNWPIHTEKAYNMKDESGILNVAIDRFLNNKLLLNAWLYHMNYIQARESPSETLKYTKLHVAAEHGLVSYVKYLIEFGLVDIDPENSGGSTPLFAAAAAGKAEMVQLLIENGAKPDRPRDSDGWYPLHVAAQCNHWQVIGVLLETGADPLVEKTKEDPGRRSDFAPRTRGHTPLMVKFPSPLLHIRGERSITVTSEAQVQAPG